MAGTAACLPPPHSPLMAAAAGKGGPTVGMWGHPGQANSWAHSWHAGCPGMGWPWIPACGSCAGLRSLWEVNAGASCPPPPPQRLLALLKWNRHLALVARALCLPSQSHLPDTRTSAQDQCRGVYQGHSPWPLAMADAIPIGKPLALPKHILHA